MRIDDYAFEQTARVVYHMNTSAQERYDSWEELKAFMVSMAYQYGHSQTTSFSTGGFHLSFAKSSVDSEDQFVTASVQAFTALQYMKSVKEKLNNICALAA